MTRPLVRLVLDDGEALYVHPARVTGLAPIPDRVTADGAQTRSLIYVGAPHLIVRNGQAVSQAWDTSSWIVRGSADDVAAVLWPQEAQRA